MSGTQHGGDPWATWGARARRQNEVEMSREAEAKMRQEAFWAERAAKIQKNQEEWGAGCRRQNEAEAAREAACAKRQEAFWDARQEKNRETWEAWMTRSAATEPAEVPHAD